MKKRWFWITTHLLAAALGVILAQRSPIESEPSQSLTAPEPRTPRSVTSATTSESTRPHLSPSKLETTWWTLAETEMGRVERNELKERLLHEWLEADPEGLLRFLEKKNDWPELIRPFKLELTDSDLGMRNPELFLAFCQSQGYDPRPRTLGGDPNVVAALVRALPEEAQGTWPTDGSPSPEQQRFQKALDAFYAKEFEKLTEITNNMPTVDEREYLVGVVAETFDDRLFNRSSLKLILRLPDKIREEVASSIFWNRSTREMTLSSSRQERRRLVEDLLKHNLPDAAVAGIDSMDNAGGSPTFDVGTLHRENADWALNLPAEERFDILRTSVFHNWTSSQPEEALAFVATLSGGTARDLAAAAVVTRAIPLGTDDEEDKWRRLRQTADLIGDEERRKSLQQRLERAQGRKGSDPFGSEGCPFD